MDKIRFEEMQIASINARTWRFYVGPIGRYTLPEYQHEAIYISNSPVSIDGTGSFTLPSIGDHCLVLYKNSRAYIIGFTSAKSQEHGGYGGILTKDVLEEGDNIRVSRTGGMFYESIRGGWHWMVDTWSKVMLGQVNQELRAWFRNLYIRSRGGHVQWETVKGTESSQYISSITDKFELDKNNDFREPQAKVPEPMEEGQPTPIYANKVITRIGAWDDALRTVEIRAGATDPGTLPNRSMFAQDMIPSGADRHVVYSGVNGSLEYAILDIDGVGLRISTPYSVITLRDSELTLSHTGNMILNPSGALYLGGTGEEQQLVTRSWVYENYVTHTHMGNGAATGPPLNVGELFDSADRDTGNFFTYDTKAE